MLPLRYPLILCLVGSAACLKTMAHVPPTTGLQSVYTIWALTAREWVYPDTPTRNIRVYLASPHPGGQLVAVSADGGTRHTGSHDAVLALDPQPSLKWGHPISIFFVDFGLTPATCKGREGRMLGNGDCLQLATRKSCNRRMMGRESCDKMQFPPEVWLDLGKGTNASQYGKLEDRLECALLLGFHQPCPDLKPQGNITTCNPLFSNSKSCDTTSYINTKCPALTICDHGVLISGGWNNQMTTEKTANEIVSMNKLLRKNGFLKENIKVFFSKGFSPKDLDIEEMLEVYPASLKHGFRHHIKTLCEVRNCADSLVIYMNSPALPDGSTLLVDYDGNAEITKNEAYSVNELIEDIKNCKAKRVVVISDQAYSTQLVKAADKQSNDLKNVIILGIDSNDPKEQLTNQVIEQYGTMDCIGQFVGIRPEGTWFVGRRPQLLNATLSGAPCLHTSDNNSPNDIDKIKNHYFGCQKFITQETLGAYW